MDNVAVMFDTNQYVKLLETNNFTPTQAQGLAKAQTMVTQVVQSNLVTWAGFRAEIQQLRAEMHAMEQSLRHEIASVEERLERKIEETKSELLQQIAATKQDNLKNMIIMTGVNIAAMGVMLQLMV